MPSEAPTSASAARRPRMVVTLLALLAALALVAGACSSDEKSSDNDDGAETAEDSDDATVTEDDSSDSDSESTGGEDFTTAVEGAMGQLEAATDPCEVFDAVGLVSQVNGPEGTEDAKVAVGYYVLLLNKMAETSSDPQVADTLRAGASAFEDYAESADYDADALDLNGAGPDYEGAEDTEAAMDQWLNTELSACVDPSQSVPAS